MSMSKYQKSTIHKQAAQTIHPQPLLAPMASTVVPTKQPKQHRNALVKICSVNLKHHFLSNKALADYINNNRIDLCLIQEPYCTQTGNMIVFSKNQIYRKSSDNADSLSPSSLSLTHSSNMWSQSSVHALTLLWQSKSSQSKLPCT